MQGTEVLKLLPDNPRPTPTKCCEDTSKLDTARRSTWNKHQMCLAELLENTRRKTKDNLELNKAAIQCSIYTNICIYSKSCIGSAIGHILKVTQRWAILLRVLKQLNRHEKQERQWNSYFLINGFQDGLCIQMSRATLFGKAVFSRIWGGEKERFSDKAWCLVFKVCLGGKTEILV